MIGWSKDYEIGINIIDEEHKEIIEEFEKLYSLMREGKGHNFYNELIAFLERYINDHFEHEEAFQDSIDYPKKEEHYQKHLEFKQKVEDLKAKYNKEMATNYELIQVNLMVKDWLLQHILVEDMKLGEYYKEKNKAGS